VRCDASDPYAFAAASRDLDGKVAMSHEINRVGWLSLPIEYERIVDILAL
jgi:hypothetical protein